MDGKEWLSRCKTCIHHQLHYEYGVVCKLPYGTECNYQRLSQEAIDAENEKMRTRSPREYMIKDGKKLCPRCKEVKELSQYYKHKTKGGKIRYSYCIDCERIYNNPNKRRRNKDD